MKWNRPISRWLGACIALTVLLGSAALALAANAFPVKLRDQFGRTVSVAREPQRIVSCSPASTEVLFALGLGRKVVGVTKWCNYPPEAKAIEQIGDILPLNVEKVAALRPDLVVANGLNGKDAVDTLTGLGLTVIALDPTSFADILASIDLLGKATGAEQAAGTLANKLKDTLRRVESMGIKTKSRGLKVFILLGDPFWTAGPGSFLDEAVTLAGGANIAHDLGSAWGQMNQELILQRNPDVIVTDIDPDTIYKNAVWRDVAAVRKKQVYRIVGDEYYRPGPRLIEALEDLAGLLEKSK